MSLPDEPEAEPTETAEDAGAAPRATAARPAEESAFEDDVDDAAEETFGAARGRAFAGEGGGDEPNRGAPEGDLAALAEAAVASGVAPPAPDARTSKLRAETEAESILGPDVRTPVGIPREYKPIESSTHELFRIELADFVGPLDLLLYLIKKHDVDILDIPIKFITDKYLEMLESMEALPIDIAAEFMVLAAELMHIKSKMLLPAREGVAVEPDEPEGDPREELVRRLLEYQKYRNAAAALDDRDQLGRDVFARVASTLDVIGDLDAGLKSVSVFKLVELMAAMLKREGGHHEIAFETISMKERIEYVLAFGEARDGRFTLTELLQGIVSRYELVVTFIAVLEMTRLGLLRLSVEEDEPKVKEPETVDAVLAMGDDGQPAPEPSPRSARLDDPPLPVIVVRLTGKKMSDEIRDDYR
ncbi:segregation/condensation protein A [Myxococcota bacterium]|nr:segregation/condensation protein A [Myxococcota bacterium]